MPKRLSQITLNVNNPKGIVVIHAGRIVHHARLDVGRCREEGNGTPCLRPSEAQIETNHRMQNGIGELELHNRGN